MPGRQRCTRLGRAGNAAVEFALVLPLLLLCLLGVFELGIAFVINGTLESAVIEASRFGTTGQENEEGKSRTDVIREIIADRTFGLIDMDEVVITTNVYRSFGAMRQPEPYTDTNKNGKWDPGEPFTDINGNGGWDPDQGKSGAGGAGDIVLYSVEYETNIFSALLKPLVGKILHRASVAVRNEPYA